MEAWLRCPVSALTSDILLIDIETPYRPVAVIAATCSKWGESKGQSDIQKRATSCVLKMVSYNWLYVEKESGTMWFDDGCSFFSQGVFYDSVRVF